MYGNADRLSMSSSEMQILLQSGDLKCSKYLKRRRNSRSFNFRRKLVWRVAERTIGGSNCFDFSAGRGT